MQTNLRRLERLGVVVPTISRGGRSKSNCYELKMPPGVAGAMKTPHAGAGFNDQKPRTPVQGLADKTPHSQVNKPRIRRSETPHAGAPVLQENYNSTSTSNADTGDRGPRQRDALGPPPETGSKGLSNGSGLAAESKPPAPPPPDPLLAKPEADLRQELGERAEWLNGAKLVARDETSVTFSVWNAHQGNNIRQHCGATILKVTSASRLDFVVERPAAANRRQR